MLQLIVLSGALKDAVVPLKGDKIGVGRDDDNELVLEDTWVSRHHAVLVRNGDGYLLRDLRSSNGSFVNGQRVQESPLKAGDRFRVGETEFRYESAPETTSADAAQLDALSRQQEALTAELAVTRQQLAQAQQQAAAAEQLATARTATDRQRLEEQLAQADGRVKQLTSELAAVGTAQQRLAEAETMIRDLTSRANGLTEQHTRLQTELTGLQQALADQERQSAERDSANAQRLAAAEADRQLLSAQLQAARAAAANPDQQAARIAELTQQAETLGAGLAARDKAGEQLRQQVAELTGRNSELSAQLTATREALTVAEQTAGRLPELTQKNEKLTAEVAAGSRQIDELQRLLTERDAAVAKLNADLAQGAGRVESLTAELANAQSRSVDLAPSQQQIEELTRKNRAAAAQLAETRELLAQTQKTLAEREAELTRWKGGASMTDQRSKQATDLATRNNVLLEEITTLRQKLFAKNAELAQLDPDSGARLKTELADVRAQLERVQGELAEARRQPQPPVVATPPDHNAEQERLRAQQLAAENHRLADELEKVRREAAQAHQRFAERVADEMKKLRREQAGAAASGAAVSPVTDFESDPPVSKGRRSGLTWFAVVALGVTVMVVVAWLVRH